MEYTVHHASLLVLCALGAPLGRGHGLLRLLLVVDPPERSWRVLCVCGCLGVGKPEYQAGCAGVRRLYKDSRRAHTRAREARLGLVQHGVQQLCLFRARDDKDGAVAVRKNWDADVSENDPVPTSW